MDKLGHFFSMSSLYSMVIDKDVDRLGLIHKVLQLLMNFCFELSREYAKDF